jgi:3-alpha domain
MCGRDDSTLIQQDDHLLRGTPYGSADRVSPTAAQLGLSASLRPRRPTEKRTGNIECPLISPLRPGTYLRIIVEGAVGAGDEIRIIERPAHDLTIRDIFRIYTRDREEVERLLAVPRLSESWRGWTQHFLEETKGRRAHSATPGCC